MPGTNKYCKNCNKTTVCESLPSKNKRFVMNHAQDIHVYERTLKCNTCFSIWETNEIEKRFVNELIVSRKLIRDLKKIANYSSNDDRGSLEIYINNKFNEFSQYDELISHTAKTFNSITEGSIVIVELKELKFRTILLVDYIKEKHDGIFLYASKAISKFDDGVWKPTLEISSDYDGDYLTDCRLINEKEFEIWTKYHSELKSNIHSKEVEH